MVNFRDSYFQVDWDLTTKRLKGTFWGKQYDTGRGFAVTVINGGQVVTATNEVLRLKWEKPDNTTGYVQATIVDGKFIVENIDQMFTVHGSVRADFELSVAGESLASITFYVSVEKAVAVDAIESSSDFTALQDALADVGDMQAQVDAVIANATVDSEVILARGTEATLGARLDSTDAQLAANMLTVKNIVKNGNFVDITSWSFISATGVVSNNEMIFTASANYGQCRQNLGELVINNKYYIRAKVKTDSNKVQLVLYKGSTGDAYALKAHSGSSEYEELSFIATPTSTGNSYIRVLDNRTSAWDEIRLSEVMIVNLTEIFGAGKEPAITEFETLLKSKNENSTFVLSYLATDLILGEMYKTQTPLYVKKTGTKIQVNSKYNATQDLRVTLDKRGGNAIFDFTQWDLIDNVRNITSTDMISGTLLHKNNTDWASPHVVKAINNINGDMPASGHFTGGNHCYNGDSTGLPTGRTVSVDLFVDGRKITDDFQGYATYIDIYQVNRVQAANTKKADGTGREVLQENFHYHFDGYKWELDRTIEFLEDVMWKTYYGLQCSNPAWNELVYYHGGTNRKWTDGTISSTSGGKTANKVTLKKGNNLLDMFLDKNTGLGDRALLSGASAIFTESYGKTYFNLVNMYESEVEMTLGDVVSYEGYYRFYSK